MQSVFIHPVDHRVSRLRFVRLPRALKFVQRGLPACVAALIVCFVGGSVLVADELASELKFREQLVPLLRTYCYDCHGAEEGEGGVSLEADDTSLKIVKGREHWMRALAQ
ncbi:c-type cytochrome domain-containing protein, partial [Rhodopirellula bahusiensis]